MEVNEFLREYTSNDLKNRGVLNTVENLLQGVTVHPLIQLMRERHVQRLENADTGWFLSEDGEFSNPKSTEQRKSGQIEHLGNVFKYQNPAMNPHYLPSPR